jgi:chromosome segregation ATPase
MIMSLVAVARLETVVAELAEAQKRTEQRVAELAEAQKRTEQRLDRLEAVVAELAEAQQRTEQRVAELAEAQKRTEQRLERLETVVAELAEAQKRTEQVLAGLIQAVEQLTLRTKTMQERLDALIGDNLERRYRERAHAYFGRVLRQVQVVPWIQIEERLEERLSEQEVDDLRPLDLLVHGRPKDASIGDELWLAVEVSKVVDRIDVERALRRAAMLRKAGYLTIPVVAGEEHTPGSDEAARDTGVVFVQDGAMRFWDEALGRVRST